MPISLDNFMQSNSLESFFDSKNINPRDVNLPLALQQRLAASRALRQITMDSNARRLQQQEQRNLLNTTSIRAPQTALPDADQERTQIIDQFVADRDKRILDENARLQAEADRQAQGRTGVALRGSASGVRGQGIGLRGLNGGPSSLLAGL